MDRIIERPEYLSQLIAKKDNGFIKVITGVRRCGKSFLLFTLYKRYLLDSGIRSDHILCLALDNILNAKYRDPLALADHLESKVKADGEVTYVFIDEIQFVVKKRIGVDPEIYVTFYDVLNSLLQKGNIDIYVTGSNSRMLSNDIATEFRGRSDELRLSPLSFAEVYRFRGGDRSDVFAEYLTYGGFPMVQFQNDASGKKKYLADLFSETYLKDISERHKIACPEAMSMIADELSSAVGSLTNSTRIAAALHSARNTSIDSETVSAYLGYLTDSFLFFKAERYDVKGKRYFSYPCKYYCVDPGLRNARLNFRQIEETHLMENVIYNDLKRRGYSVDVGVVESVETKDGKRERTTNEIDFVVNAQTPGERYYIQSALNLDSPDKSVRELRPFLKLNGDFTKRIVITKTSIEPWTDEYGIVHAGIYDFLLDKYKI